MKKVLAYAEAKRPTLTNPTDIAVLDSVVERLRSPSDTKGALSEIAEEIGVTKGTVSKSAARLRKIFGK